MEIENNNGLSYWKFWNDYEDLYLSDSLSDEEKVELLKTQIMYSHNTEETINFKSRTVAVVFESLKPRMKRDIDDALSQSSQNSINGTLNGVYQDYFQTFGRQVSKEEKKQYRDWFNNFDLTREDMIKINLSVKKRNGNFDDIKNSVMELIANKN
ncbi:MAG: hypothetical protein WBH77_07035 [Saccharofermentanales bacterium]